LKDLMGKPEEKGPLERPDRKTWRKGTTWKTWSENLKKRGHLKDLIGKLKEKESLERPKCRWEYVIWNLAETGCGPGSSASKEGPVTGFCELDNEVSGSIKCATGWVHQDRHSEIAFWREQLQGAKSVSKFYDTRQISALSNHI
jgi:hypothetical protein